MPTRNVVLTQHHEDVIEKLVKSGRYQNASEVLREGLRMIEQRERLEAIKEDAFISAAKHGFDDIERGRFKDVADGAIEDFITALGQSAEARLSGRDEK